MVLNEVPSSFSYQGHPVQGDIHGNFSNSTLGFTWKVHHIMFHVDNTAVASTLSSGTNQNMQVMNISRSIIMVAVQIGFSYSSSWISLADNPIADATSCFEYICLFTL